MLSKDVFSRPLKPRSPESRLVEVAIYHYEELGYDPYEGEILKGVMQRVHTDVVKRTKSPGRRAISPADVAEFLWKFGKLLNKQ